MLVEQKKMFQVICLSGKQEMNNVTSYICQLINAAL